MHIFVLSYLKDAEKILTAGGLATRSEKCAAEIEPTEEDVRKMTKYAKEMKLSSVLDFPWYIISIKDVSRSFTHQWVRYRVAAHMQQSLRYVKIDPTSTRWFVVPPSIIEKGEDAVLLYIENQQKTGKTYLKLLEEGVPTEDARFALPIGTKTHISTAFDAEELLHVIQQRTCFDAQWEIRIVAYALLLAGLIIHPHIFKNAGPYCVSEGICRGSNKGRCLKEAKEIVEKIKQIANEKRKEFDSMKAGEKLEIELTEVLGFKAPKKLEESISSKLSESVDLSERVFLTIRKN